MLLWIASHWLWIAGAAFVALCFAIPGTAAFLFGTKFGRVVFLTVSLLAVGYWQRTDGHADGVRETTAKYEQSRKEWERAAALQVASASLAESEAIRAAEEARNGAINSAGVAYQRGLQDGKAAVEGTVADLRADNLQLRKRFQCPAASPAGATATSAAGGDGEAQPGLSRADAEFLVRLAGEADDAVRQLTACQAVIDADRLKLRKDAPTEGTTK